MPNFCLETTSTPDIDMKWARQSPALQSPPPPLVDQTHKPMVRMNL